MSPMYTLEDLDLDALRVGSGIAILAVLLLDPGSPAGAPVLASLAVIFVPMLFEEPPSRPPPLPPLPSRPPAQDFASQMLREEVPAVTPLAPRTVANETDTDGSENTGASAPPAERNILGVVAKVGMEVAGRVLDVRKRCREVLALLGQERVGHRRVVLEQRPGGQAVGLIDADTRSIELGAKRA